jgi:uncharacterized protein YjiK
MTRIEKFAFVVVGLIFISLLLFWKDLRSATAKEEVEITKAERGKKRSGKKESANPEITIVQKWDLPPDLLEVSGIAYLDKNRFACVQDELGKIFIFNTEDKKVEKEIDFAGPGDYEGICLVGSTAYVLRADGNLFEVKDFNTRPSVAEYPTHLTVKQNVEGLTYDQKNNRLLLAIKGKEPGNEDYKGIYHFDLSSKKTQTAPAYKIDLNHKILKEVKGKNKMQPSDLEIHPATGDIYVVDGSGPQLLVMGEDGTKKKLYQLSSAEFSQPEGISFTPGGELFISNEGKKGAANILQVVLEPINN